jgi:hypothetical protein
MQITPIPLELVQFDIRNPRIAHAIEGLETEKLDDAYVELVLGRSSPADEEGGSSTTYSSLKASIKAKGGLISPIIVRTADSGKFTVVEGNTRVAIFRELNRGESNAIWQTIPAIIYTAIEEVDEHAIRLQSHLVGPRPWKAYAKGKYLHFLYHHRNWPMSQLLEFCGGNARKREIEEYIEAYADMERCYSDELRAGRGYSQFSAFVELQKPEIKVALARNGYKIEDFAKWLADGHIQPLNTVRYLPRILNNPAAKRAFLTHNAREAIKFLEQPSASALLKDAPLEQLAFALAERLRTEPWPSLRQLFEEPEGQRATAVLDCYSELRGLVQHLGVPTDEPG